MRSEAEMWKLKTITIIAVLGVLTIGAAFSLSLTGCNREDNQVNPKNDTRLSEAAIPAIDAAAPIKTETATFALG
jgi:hypothetical protein